jgi:hypothetical protein
VIKVERAVNLFKAKMIEEKTTSRGVTQLVIRKSENPETKKNSGYLTDFSWDIWNTAAEEYMESIKALDNKRILEILNLAFAVPDYVGRKMRRQAVASHGETSRSARAALHSDVETDGRLGDDTVRQANGGGEPETAQAHVGGAANDDVNEDPDSEAPKPRRLKNSSRSARKD